MEDQIKELGKRLFAGMRQGGPGILTKDYWQGQLMELSMRSEAFKVRMFQFVDVFPKLQSSREIARHFREYFPDLEGVPALFRAGMASAKLGSAIPGLNVAADYAISKTADVGVRQMAKRFITAETAADALRVIERMRGKNIGFTVDVLGEATVNEAEAAEYQQTYLELIPTLAKAAQRWPANPQVDGRGEFQMPAVNLSIKLSSL